MPKEAKLPVKVAKKYECTRVPGRHIIQRPVHKEIDLCTITVAEADELVKNGFPYLVPKSKSTNAKASKDTKE